MEFFFFFFRSRSSKIMSKCLAHKVIDSRLSKRHCGFIKNESLSVSADFLGENF